MRIEIGVRSGPTTGRPSRPRLPFVPRPSCVSFGSFAAGDVSEGAGLDRVGRRVRPQRDAPRRALSATAVQDLFGRPESLGETLSGGGADFAALAHAARTTIADGQSFQVPPTIEDPAILEEIAAALEGPAIVPRPAPR